jgi:PAS domain-containing protein
MFSANRIKYIHFIGLLIILAGGSNLIGWQFDITLLKSFSSEMTSMNPLTAITFIVAGVWLYFFSESNVTRKKLSFGIFVLIIGLLHILANHFSLDFLRLDHYIFKEKVESSLINSHLAHTTALLFFLSGIIIISSTAQKKWLLNIRQILCIIIFVVAYSAILGYLRTLGEKRRLYSTEFGIELHTIIFTIVIFILVYFYANLLNKKQIASLLLETQLAESESKFRKLVASLREGVASIDYNGKLVYCNPSYCSILGYTEDELVNSSIIEMIIPIDKRVNFLDRSN